MKAEQKLKDVLEQLDLLTDLDDDSFLKVVAVASACVDQDSLIKMLVLAVGLLNRPQKEKFMSIFLHQVNDEEVRKSLTNFMVYETSKQ